MQSDYDFSLHYRALPEFRLQLRSSEAHWPGVIFSDWISDAHWGKRFPSSLHYLQQTGCIDVEGLFPLLRRDFWMKINWICFDTKIFLKQLYLAQVGVVFLRLESQVTSRLPELVLSAAFLDLDFSFNLDIFFGRMSSTLGPMSSLG